MQNVPRLQDCRIELQKTLHISAESGEARPNIEEWIKRSQGELVFAGKPLVQALQRVKKQVTWQYAAPYLPLLTPKS